jgi:hypothetical protein
MIAPLVALMVSSVSRISFSSRLERSWMSRAVAMNLSAGFHFSAGPLNLSCGTQPSFGCDLLNRNRSFVRIGLLVGLGELVGDLFAFVFNFFVQTLGLLVPQPCITLLVREGYASKKDAALLFLSGRLLRVIARYEVGGPLLGKLELRLFNYSRVRVISLAERSIGVLRCAML